MARPGKPGKSRSTVVRHVQWRLSGHAAGPENIDTVSRVRGLPSRSLLSITRFSYRPPASGGVHTSEGLLITPTERLQLLHLFSNLHKRVRPAHANRKLVSVSLEAPGRTKSATAPWLERGEVEKHGFHSFAPGQ